MSLFRILFAGIILLQAATLASAQTASPKAFPQDASPKNTSQVSNAAPSNAAVPASEPKQQSAVGAPARVVFWNREITTFRSYFDALSPEERAAKAVERLRALPEVAPEWRITAKEATSGERSGMIVAVNEQFAFGILNEDLDHESGETLQAASDHATAQLRAALEARAQQHRLPTLLRGIGLALAATLILLVGLWLLVRARRKLLVRLDQAAAAQGLDSKAAGFNAKSLLHRFNRALTTLTTWAFAVVFIYLWLTFVLLRFPYSQPWGQQLGGFLVNLFESLGSGFLQSIPGMFTVVVIFLVTRIVTRLIGAFFHQIEKGELMVPWLHSDTARATRHLVLALIWVFAIVVAYPYVPGSSTEAFKGVSVLVGLMISLGSAGLINQVMSGLVVVYSRALKPGELVKVDDHMGMVTDVGMLSTKIRTRKREEITIPNAVLVGKKMVNYSRQEGGACLAVTLTIGYDAPWRLVHAMLLEAADKTAGVLKEPAPRVWQTALSDFYVEYELVVNLEKPATRLPVLSELNAHIQDAFNENGVQIMSPHFEGQPKEKVWVPKSEWFPGNEVAADGEKAKRMKAEG